MEKGKKTKLFALLNSAPFKAGLNMLVMLQVVAPIIQTLAALKTLFK